MADMYGRPLLPQATFAWQPPITEKLPKQTNYVFVDEHNRSRRLKVMRACENCRKRKIKCDAATTNIWPCGACLKQRLSCAPPVLNLEKGEIPELSTRETIIKRDDSIRKTPEMKREPAGPGIHSASPDAPVTSVTYQMGTSISGNKPASQPETPKPQPDVYNADQPAEIYHANSIPPQSSPPAVHSIYEQSNPLSPARSASTWSETPDTDLTETMKELNIDSVGMAVYINKKSLADKAAIFDAEPTVSLPTNPGGQVRIPDSMMPEEKEAQLYFSYFFDNVHQYIPVLNRASFMHQWAVDKQSISPLVLEAIFAITTQLLKPSSAGNKWLDLASQHEKAFDDVSRLSTVQGLLLLLKARESVPRRGYYWRSWMQIAKIVVMAKDLELSQHLELHQMGRPCGSSSRVECHTKIRTWQTCFILELMIGGPQGRQFQISLDSVDFEFPDNLKYISDDPEENISRQFTNLAKAISNVRTTMAKYASLRKERPDWALDQRYQEVNKSYDAWLRNLPDQYQIYFPQDSTTPQIPSHFIANMHCYYYLSIVMHHRPQLEAAQTKGPLIFMNQLIICYTAATRLCRLQEAILEEYGLDGLLWMPRGVNFSIYAILTSTMLHLVALTCPDSALNYDAIDYFPRHMRILERCVANWPMPEMQAQVRSLQEAFSADPSKPFELRADFPRADSLSRGSPRSDQEISESQTYTSLDQPAHTQFQHSTIAQHMFQDGQRQSDLASEALHPQNQFEAGYNQDYVEYNAHPSHQYENWDPSKISALWTTAFEPSPAAYEQGSPNSQQHSTPPPNQPQFTQNVTNVTNVQYNTYTNAPFTNSSYSGSASPANQWSQFQPPQMQTYVGPNAQAHVQQQMAQPAPTFRNPFAAQASITPGMWQDAVTSSYGLGSKRHFSDASETYVPAQKRVR